MDVTPTHQDPATGDDELAKVLAGVTDDPSAAAATAPGVSPALQFEETPKSAKTKANEPTAQLPAPEVATSQSALLGDTQPEPAITLPQAPMPATAIPAPTLPNQNGLEDIKKNALEELRPLVDKLNLPPEEKFDTLLLIIRSTDDRSLVEAAHETAKSIVDETKRAQALLDVIKEIDYFSTQNTPQ